VALYKYYQKTGGEEKWQVVRADTDLTEISPTFVTILSLDTLGTLKEDEPTRELLSGIKYYGPMYFDLDSADLEESIDGANELLGKLYAEGLQESDLEIYLSGKKGLHIIVSPICFMEKQMPVQYLPAIYKEIAFRLATQTVDFKVYTARTGRMLRTCHNIRENGNYRVPVTAAELKTMTPELYNHYCSAKRHVPAARPEFRAAFSLIYDAAKQKVAKSAGKKAKPVDAKTIQMHLPILQQVMRGEVAPGVGFNKVAIQLAIYARDSGMSADALVDACSGLINSHNGDGSRYNTTQKREYEIRRMCDYVEGNLTYDYAIGPVKALLPRANGASAEPTFDAEGNLIPAGAPIGEAFSCGVTAVGHQYVASKGDAGDIAISNFVFTEVISLVMVGNDEIIGLKVCLTTATKKSPPIILTASQFTGSSGLQNAVAPYGGSFSGSDIHSRGILQLMLHEISGKKYIIDSEGINMVSIPLSDCEELREPFVVWADTQGVKVPPALEGLAEFDFSGHPDPRGLLQTDLTEAPTLEEYLAVSDEHRQFALDTLTALFNCQSPETIGKMLGWMVACFWRQQFHLLHGKFPLLHIYGPAGLGKTDMVTALLKLFYYNETPKAVAPSGTPFAFLQFVGGSGSIPILLDEYKPGRMAPDKLEQYRSVLREAYNMKDSVRGGGSRTKDAYNALNRVSLSGPIIVVAEAPETETAILERSVVISLRKPTPAKHSRNYVNFLKMVRGKVIFSSIGHSIAASVLADTRMGVFTRKFNHLHDRAIASLMVQPEDAEKLAKGELTQEEFNSKQNNKPRAIYSNAVALYGLLRLRELLKSAIGEEFDGLFGEHFQAMQSSVFNGLNDQAANMVPEYIKILTTMGDMTQLALDDRLRLTEGLEYNLSEIGGRPVLALAPRAAYSKYRMHCRGAGMEYFYASELSFTQAMREIPQFLRIGKGTARAKVDTLIFDLEDLQRAGVSNWAGKAVQLPS
jgi:hypothetical protein